MCSKKHLRAITKQNENELRFSHLDFHNFRMIIFHDQKTLSLNFIVTSVSLYYYVTTKIFID